MNVEYSGCRQLVSRYWAGRRKRLPMFSFFSLWPFQVCKLWTNFQKKWLQFFLWIPSQCFIKTNCLIFWKKNIEFSRKCIPHFFKLHVFFGGIISGYRQKIVGLFIPLPTRTIFRSKFWYFWHQNAMPGSKLEITKSCTWNRPNCH